MNDLFRSIVTCEKYFEKKSLTYVDEQKSSRLIDQTLGLEVDRVEQGLVASAKLALPEGNYKSWGPNLYNGNQAWVGLSADQLQTTYAEFSEICKFLKSKFDKFTSIRFLDFGAAYGRLGFVVPIYFDNASFLGYEIVEQRVEHANSCYRKLGLINSSLESVDVLASEFDIINAEVIFIYDIGEFSHIKVLVDKIEQKYDKGERFVLIARGRGVNGVIAKYHPWMLKEYTSEFNSFNIYNCL